MKILCNRNKGYRWTVGEGVFFKGFVIESDGNVLRDTEALKLFESISNYQDFVETLGVIEGCFSVIVEKGSDEVWGAVDIERTMPLYYSLDLDIISDDADVIREEKEIAFDEVDAKRCLEMYGACYISYQNTIYESIKQIDYKNAICIKKGKLSTSVYYEDKTPIKDWDRKSALLEMKEKYENAIKRSLKVIGNRKIILSLSGGYDSRCIACTLKNLGVENVLCLAYGDRNSFEIQVSERVARALGYQWKCIEYSDEDQLGLLEDHDFLEYTKDHDYTLYVQNYAAIKKAVKTKILPDPTESVFLVGLINDVTVGHYTPSREEALVYGFSDDGLADFIVRDSFARFELRKDVHDYFHRLVMKSIDKYGTHVKDYQSFVTAWDDLNLGRGHSRNYPKMNRVHEFYGYEWIMPFMDKELMSFWRSIPVEMRLDHNLFEEFITEHLAKQYGVGEKKVLVPNAKTPIGNKIKRKLGGIATRILYPLGIPLKRKNDINHFAPLEVRLYKEIKQKDAIKYKRAGIRHLIEVYSMERKYGTKWFALIKGKIR